MERVTLEPNGPLRVSQATHEGMTGKNNEDALLFIAYRSRPVASAPVFYLSIVADGVGGQTAGEYASKLAIETITAYFDQIPEIMPETILSRLKEAITLANEQVIEKAQSDPMLQGMATTVVAVAVIDGLLFISHVGDSRAYLWRPPDLFHLTTDHTWVQEAVDAGLLTAEQGFKHPNRNIIRRSLGSLEDLEIDQEMPLTPQADIWQGMPLQPGDLILICSDGLTDMISDRDVALTLDHHRGELDAVASSLIDKANEAGGRDNISVILLQMAEDFTANEASPFPRPSPPAETVVGAPAVEADMAHSIPRVVSVPIKSDARKERARRWRFWLVILLLFVLAYLTFMILVVSGVLYI